MNDPRVELPAGQYASNTGNAQATGHGIANAGILNITQLPRVAPPQWPILVGQVPGLASAFQPREELRGRITAARGMAGRSGSAGVVLTSVLSGGGGVGKSQLAAWFARDATTERTDLVVWVNAAALGGVIEGYALAGAKVQAPGVTGEPGEAEQDAQRFLEWLAATNKTWLVVLDNIEDPDLVAGWWPTSHTGTGWALGTTRRRDAMLTGAGRRMVDVDVYSPDEATNYLTERVTDAGKAHLLDEQVHDLAEELGYLPLGLSHAAAYMITQRRSCGDYLKLYRAQTSRLDQLMPGDPDGHGRDPDGHLRTISTTLLLALNAADKCEPVGTAKLGMDLASVLDPAGHPVELWETKAVTAFLTHSAESGRPETDVDMPGLTDASGGRKVALLLDRFGLVTFDEQDGLREVRVHAVTARAVRESNPQGHASVITTAADALMELWPEHDYTNRALVAVLRTNASIISQHSAKADDVLWHLATGGHWVLWRVGASLQDIGMYAEAANFWQEIADRSLRVFGPDHPDTLTSRNNLAGAYQSAGDLGRAIPLYQQTLEDRERVLGPDHPNTLGSRNNLAGAYQSAGDLGRAIPLYQQTLEDTERVLGPDHPNTLTSRNNLAGAWWEQGRYADAFTAFEEAAGSASRLFGDAHEVTRQIVENRDTAGRMIAEHDDT